MLTGVKNIGDKFLLVLLLLAVNYGLVPDSHRFHDTGNYSMADNNDTNDD
jgi:hypothetical protein